MGPLTEALPGIWFWELAHPDWRPGDSWAPEVRCWAIRTSAGVALVDPLVDSDADDGTRWAALDALGAETPITAVIRTLHYHHRSCAQASARYDVPIYAREPPRPDLPAHPFDRALADGGTLPGGIVAHHLERDDEVALWIADAGALLFAVGQRRAGRFELCPDWWVSDDDSWSMLRDQMRALAMLAPSHLLVSHGPHDSGDGDALAGAVDRAAARPLPPFIAAAELAARRDTWKLVDARMYLDGRSARAAYESGHLPGALFLDFEATLSAPPDPAARHGRHPLPTPERFAAGLAAAGISDGDTVVAYDDAGGVIAARLVWMLRAIGEDAALLSPVPEATEPGPPPSPAHGHVTARPWPPQRLASIADVAAITTRAADAADPGAGPVLLDARDPARFAGGPDPYDPRAGHIPGAVNLPCRANIEAGARIAPRERLAERFAAAGVDANTEVISSCGSGVTACHTLLALEHLHYRPGRLYPGSFSEWSRDPQRAVATGEA